MTIIVDSNYLFALKSEKDKYYKRALELMSQLKDVENNFITNYLVINETFTLAIARSKADSILLEKIYDIAWGQDRFFEIVQFEPENYEEIYEILKKFSPPKRLLSFVDASLIYLYQKRKADYILSFDSHFDNISKRYY